MLKLVIVVAAFLLLRPQLLFAQDAHAPTNPHSIYSAVKDLVEGNARFAAGKAMHPHQKKKLMNYLAVHGQSPLAVVMGCSDSREPVEEIFDMGAGDLFVIRTAGAVIGVDQIGSMEYAVGHLGGPVVLRLSHTNCGRVTAAVNGANEPGFLGEVIKKMDPVIKAVAGLDESKRLDAAIELSAKMFKEQLPLMSPVLAEAISQKRLLVISGNYDIAVGQVKFDLPEELEYLQFVDE
ncbi:MAG: carbonic anhydrase [Deltaproteobacteria bacterium]|jgi:carbonic anhydrase|nr:carbonic anhydrase [Deltaproteobacteria bacterium]